MSTTTTSARTIGVPDTSDSSPARPARPRSEPAISQRERAVLREILRLVAERADAEAKVERDRTCRVRRGRCRIPKDTSSLDRKAARSRKRGRSRPTRSDGARSSTPRSTASARPRRNSPPPAASSPPCSMPRAMRPRTNINQAKNDVAASFDSGQRKAAKEYAEKTKPIDDSAGMANGYRRAPGDSRCRLPQVQTQSRGARADSRVVRPL